MIDKIKELFAKHPYLLGAGAVVVFLGLFLLLRGSSGSTASGTAAVVSSGTDPNVEIASIQAGAAQQAQQAQISAQSAQDQLSITAQQNSLAAQLAQTQIQAGVLTTQYNDQLQLGLDTNSTQLQGLFSNNDTALKETYSNNDTSVSLATLQAQTQQLQISQQYGYLGTVANDQSAVAISQVQGNVAIAGIQANSSDTIASLNAQMAATLVNASVLTAQYNAQTANSSLQQEAVHDDAVLQQQALAQVPGYSQTLLGLPAYNSGTTSIGGVSIPGTYGNIGTATNTAGNGA